MLRVAILFLPLPVRVPLTAATHFMGHECPPGRHPLGGKNDRVPVNAQRDLKSRERKSARHVVRRRNSAARDTSGEAEGRRFSARNGSVYNGRVPDTVEDSLMMPSLRFACAALALGLATAGHKRSRSRPTAFIACPSQRLYPTTRRLPSAWM
jgi:hypothetical protein